MGNCDVYLTLSTQFIPRVPDVKDIHCVYVAMQRALGVINTLYTMDDGKDIQTLFLYGTKRCT